MVLFLLLKYIKGDSMKNLIKDIKYGEKENNLLDVYLPSNSNFQTIIYFHGGGLEVGDKQDNNVVEIANSLVKKGYSFVSVNYSLYPNVKCPDFIFEGAKAIDFVNSHLKSWGGNGEVIICGQSAGAYISVMLCVDKKYLSIVKTDNLKIVAWCIESAQMTEHYNVLREKGLDTRLQRINEFSPLYFVNENTLFSKMLLLFYDNDIPCRLEQNMLFYKSVLNFNPKAKISYKILKGGHCRASCEKDEDGEYEFVKVLSKWLNNE